jgi:DNA-binding NtrC family response regulator
VFIVEDQTISPGSEMSCASVLFSGLEYERRTWQEFRSEQLIHSPACVAILNAVPETEQATSFLERLNTHPIPVPTLAVLANTADTQRVKAAADAVDDFVLAPPLPKWEINLRISRLMGPDKGRVDAQTLLASELCLAELVGRDAAFLRAVEQTPTFAATNAPVLITGETGTGKELFARAIHALSKRRHGPFIPVDCAGLPEQLAENELFGHSRGAFTDAHAPQRGLAALAEGGTLFLDEIDALSLANQAKLLRFLQEGTYRALGAESFTRADVRVIAATNRNIEDCVERREFRSDLYFRINVLRLHLPPLRERRGDIVLLARSFLASHSDKGEGTRKVFSVAALRKLESYRWPGNLRELFNTVQRAFVTCPGREIFPRHVALPNDAKEPRGNAHFRTAKAEAISSFEKTYIAEVLAACGGNISRAAREAGKERRAFGRLVKKYGLRDRVA